MRDYTPDQKHRIDKAFSIVAYAATRTDQKMSFRLERAIAGERRERGSISAAKASLLAAFAAGTIGDVDGSTLYGMSDGCASAYMIGARMRASWPDLIDPAMTNALAAAEAAHRDAIDARWAALR